MSLCIFLLCLLCNTLRYTNADFKISLYVCFYIKVMPEKFHVLDPRNPPVIHP